MAAGRTQQFREQRQERSEARLADALQQIPDDIAAGSRTTRSRPSIAAPSGRAARRRR